MSKAERDTFFKSLGDIEKEQAILLQGFDGDVLEAASTRTSQWHAAHGRPGETFTYLHLDTAPGAIVPAPISAQERVQPMVPKVLSSVFPSYKHPN